MNTFLFDLDGTLLPMNQEEFIEAYFKSLTAKLTPHGLEPKSLVKAVWASTKAMIENDGSMLNEQRFWDTFSGIMGEGVLKLLPVFEEYYLNDFKYALSATTTNTIVSKCINMIKDKGYMLVIATNPLFPKVATYSRIAWAGLNPEDFHLITTYENSSYCKPNLNYYKEILNVIDKESNECIMVGNDVTEDMCVKGIGIDTFLLTDCLINTTGEDISGYKQGDFNKFYEFVKDLPYNSL